MVHESPREIAEDRRGLARLLNPFGRLWLRIVARVLEHASDLVPTHLNLSWITDQLAVGGAPKKRDYRRLAAAGITAVIDCREEDSDDEQALAKVGIRLLHLPIKDRYAHSGEQLRTGADWAIQAMGNGGKVLVHCQHGVGRGPLVGGSILISMGLSAPEAVKTIRTRRWQAAPNDRQLEALLAYEERLKRRAGRSAEGPRSPGAPARPPIAPPSAPVIPPPVRPTTSRQPPRPAEPGGVAPAPPAGERSLGALQARLNELQRRLESDAGR